MVGSTQEPDSQTSRGGYSRHNTNLLSLIFQYRPLFYMKLQIRVKVRGTSLGAIDSVVVSSQSCKNVSKLDSMLVLKITNISCIQLARYYSASNCSHTESAGLLCRECTNLYWLTKSNVVFTYCPRNLYP